MKRPAFAFALLLATLSAALPALAQSGPDTWSEPPGVPLIVAAGGSIVATDADTLFILRGSSSTNFYKYTISTKIYTAMTAVPALVSYGGYATFMPGTNFIYVTTGNNSLNFFRYNISTNTWTTNPTIAALPATITAYYGSSLTSTASKVYFLRGFGSTMFYEFDPAAAGGVGAWTVKAVAPAIVSYGGIVVWPGTGTTLYATMGNNTNNFQAYDIVSNTWSPLAPVPGFMYYGGAMAPGIDEGGSKILLAFRGGGSVNFYKYNINLNSWTTLVSTPAAVSYGAGIVYPGTGTTIFCLRGSSTEMWQYNQPGNNFVVVLNPSPVINNYGAAMTGINDGKTLFALHGGNSTALSKCDTSTPFTTWSSMAPLPVGVGYGGTLTWGGGDYLYCTPGNFTNAFYRYQISTNTWAGSANGINQCPDTVYYGGFAVWGGGDYINVARGYYTATWWRYSIANNLWEVMTAAPGPFSWGACGTWTGGNLLHILQGNSSTAFWTYSQTGDSWVATTPHPQGVTTGGSICYPGSGNYIFVLAGGGATYRAFNLSNNTWASKAAAPANAANGTCLAYPGAGKFIYAFKGVATNTFWRYWIDSLPPLVPAGAAQRNLTDTADIAQGATVNEPGVKFKATVTDQDNNQVKLQIELISNASSFTTPATYVGSDNITFFESPFTPSGSVIVITKLGLANGSSWKWQYRSVDMTERVSAWTLFGSPDPDFTISATGGTTPGAPNLGPAAGIGQFLQNGTTVLGIGATTNQSSMVMKGTAVSTQSWRLEAQVAKVGQPYTTSLFGNFVASGGISTATFVFSPPPTSDGNYQWRARAVNSYDQFSGWIDFNNNNGVTDFNVLINVPPAIPLALDQIRTLTSVSIPVAGGSYEGNVTFRGTLNDPNAPDILQLQLELKQVGTPFDGTTGLTLSASGANLSVVNIPITGLGINTQWHWRARCLDNSGIFGPWQPFGGNLETQPDFTVTQPPNPPTWGGGPNDLKQYKYDEVTLIGVGGTTPEPVFVVKGQVTTPSTGVTLRLQVEVKPVAVAFNQTITATSLDFNPGQIASVFIPNQLNGSFQWRARTFEVQSGIASNWTDYGGNLSNPPGPTAATDIVIAAGANQAPNAPTLSGAGSLVQYWFDGVTVIPVGGNTPDPGIVVKATISDPNLGTTLRLEVECKDVDIDDPFNASTDMFYSPFVSSGTQAAVTCNVGAGASGQWYHWRARTKDSTGAFSPWVNFGGNTEADADFVTLANTAPGDIFDTNLNQGKLDDSAPIADAGTCIEPGIRFVGIVSDPDNDPVQIEFEVKPTGQAFDGTGTFFSPFGPASSPIFANYLGLANNTDYHWRARGKDDKGKVSLNWTEFEIDSPASLIDFHTTFSLTNVAPAVPSVGPFDQSWLDGTNLPVGNTVTEAGVKLYGAATDPDAGTAVRIEFEVRDINTAFTGTPTHVSLFTQQSQTVAATVTGLLNVSYHWRKRAADAWGATSAWVSWNGVNSDGAPPGTPADADFIVAAPNANPNDIVLVLNAAQFKLDGSTSIALGGTSPQTGVVMKAAVSDPDIGNTVAIQVELKLVGGTFDGLTGLYEGSMVPSGNTSSVTITGLANAPTNYMWRCRAKDQAGAFSVSWTYFSLSSTAEIDFTLTPNSPPTLVGDGGQFKLVGDPIPVGGASDISGAVFKGTVNDPNGAADMVRLQVEVQPLDLPFLGSPTIESAPVVPGVLASVTLIGLANGDYHWQYRGIDSNNVTTGWLSFGANSDGAPPGVPAALDFSVLINAPPAVPTSFDQFKFDGVTNLLVGATTDEPGFKVSGTVSDPDGNTVKLEVEAKLIGSTYNGAGIVSSGLVASGSVATAQFNGPNGDYRWRVRAVDQYGIASPWDDTFGGNDASTGVDVTITSNTPPVDPTTLAQFKANGTTAIAIGTNTDETSVVLKAFVDDPDVSDLLSIEAEVKPTGTAFTGTGTVIGSTVATGSTASVTVTGLTNGTYHWRVRTLDNNGGISGWVSYPDPTPNLETATDFGVNLGAAPTLGSVPTQHDTPASGSVGAGFLDDDQSMTFKAIVNDIDGGATISLEVEIEAVTAAFDGAGTVTGVAVSTGATAEVTVGSLADGSYHWRVRAVDNSGQTSAWVVGLGNLDAPLPAEIDFTIDFVNDPPATPLSAFQSFVTMGPQQGVGAVNSANTMFFRATVTDPNAGIGQQVRIQVEVKLEANPFDGATNLTLGTLVNSGSISEAQVTGLADGDYHWQARAVDAAGTPSSGWFVFDAGATPDFTIDFVNDTPGDITSAIQSDDPAGVSVGTTFVDNDLNMSFRAIVTDPNFATLGQQVRIQVEIKPTGTAFDGTTGLSSGNLVNSGLSSEVTVALVGDDTYHWRCRGLDAANLPGNWFAFGGNLDPGDTDFTINATNVAPTITGGINQYMLNGTTVIAAGADTLETGVVLKATVVDTDPGDQIFVDVEVQLNGTALTGTPNYTGTVSVLTGATAAATAQPLATGNYHWGIRARDAGGLTSAWSYFGTNNPATKDFGISLGTAPTWTSGPTQHDESASPAAPPVLVSANTSIVFKCTPNDVDLGQTIKLQVEIKDITTAFNGAALAESAFVTSGTPIELTVNLFTDGSYHWRARLVDSNTLDSGWTNFGGNLDAPLPAEIDFIVDATNDAPTTPAAAIQSDTAAGASQPTTYVDNDGTVFFSATVTDVNGPTIGQQVRIEVEVKPTGTAFNGTTGLTLGNLVASGGTSEAQVTGLADGTYHWRARAVDAAGLASSGWFAFGGNPEPSGIDFTMDAVNDPPTTPSGAIQSDDSLSASQPTTYIDNDGTIFFSTTVNDVNGPSVGQQVRIEVEVKPTGTAFNGTTGLTLGNLVADGGTSEAQVTGLADGTYHWRARAVDAAGLASSGWFAFGANLDPGDTDFTMDATNDAPTTPTTAIQSDVAAGASELTTYVDNDGTIFFSATVTDPNVGQQVRIEVEVKLTGTAFDGTTGLTLGNLVASGGTSEAQVTGLADGTYHWRARAVDAASLASSGWFAFGGNPEPSGVDFTMDAVNDPPATPATAIQSDIAAGASQGTTYVDNDGTIFFSATVTDVNGPTLGQQVRVEVEVKLTGTAFDGTTGLTLGNLVASGGTSEAQVTGLADGTYHWRARAVDAAGLASSGWFAFGANLDPGDTDFTMDAVNDAPATPASAIQSFTSLGVLQNPPGITTSNFMFFRATVTDPNGPTLGQQVRIEVEVKATGVAFDGTTGLAQGNLVASGGTSEVQVTALADGTYHWRARAVDAAALPSSGWFAFGANLDPGDTDFTIDAVNALPTVPSGGTQHDDVAGPAELPGFTDLDNTMVFKCNVVDTDPSQTVAIQVEVKPVASAFDDLGLVTGSFVTTGVQSVATVGSLANGGYKWRYRALDSFGGFSTWVEFDAGGLDDFTIAVVGTPPTISGSPTQHDESPDAAAPEAFIDLDSQFVFKGTVNDIDGGQTIKLRVEVKPQGTAFDGTTNITESASVVSGTLAVVTVPGLTDGSYHWQYQAIDSNNITSSWVEFAANGTPDFTIDAVNLPPGIPTGAQQYEADGTTVIPPTGATLGSTVIFKATVTDSDPSNLITLQVERALAGTGFASPTLGSSPAVATGLIATVTMAGLADGDYEWRYRATDGTNTTAWTEFVLGGAIDFTVNAISDPPTMTGSPTQHPTPAAAAVPEGYVNIIDGNMTFKCTVADTDPGATAGIQVEIVVNATPYLGAPLVTGTMVATGLVSEVTVTKPAGNYAWRARVIDNTGAFSAWVEFAPANVPDYTINGAPSLPSVIGQFLLDTVTAIVAGGTTVESGVVFKATVSDPEGHQCKLEVELQLLAGSFTGASNTPAAPLVNSGSVSTITVSGLADASYKWRYRVVDQYNAATAWTDFPPGDPDFIVNAPANAAPTDPSALGLTQHKADTVTLIGPGATTNENTVVFKSPVSDPDGDACKIEVEVQPTGTAFTGTPTAATSPLVPNGSTASATVTGLASIVDYHWQARIVDSNGAASNWVSFGTNPDNVGEIDFNVNTSLNAVPNLPASLGQFKLDTITVIAIGTSTNENGVVFRATITDPDANLVRLLVEVQPNGTPFTGTATAQSALMASGSIASVTVSGLADGAYHWQAWAQDSAGGLSGFAVNGGNPDFIIDVTNVAPNVPTADTQFRSDGITVIPDAGSTNETTVIFSATVSDADFSQVALQVEVVPTASAFTGTPTSTSPMVANNGTATITVSGLTNLTSYKWRFRAIDPIGATSLWSDHAAGDPDFSVDTNNPPLDPAALAQRKLDNVTVIPNGAATDEAGFTARATVIDADAGDLLRLQVEVRLTGSAFTNLPTATGTPVTSGTTATVQVTGLVPGSAYKWQARTIDAGGKLSNWIAFVTDPAFSVLPNVVPNIPVPTQNNPSGGAAVAVGARVYNVTSMMYQAMISDAGGEAVRFEVEVQAVGTAFTNIASAASPMMPSGSLASVTVAAGDGRYHWQFRVVDASALSTAWTSFGGNTEAETDFEIITMIGSENSRACISSAASAGSLGWLALLALLVLLALRRPALRRR